MFWTAILKLALYALEEFGDDIVKSTKNPFDDVALKAVVNALKLYTNTSNHSRKSSSSTHPTPSLLD